MNDNSEAGSSFAYYIIYSRGGTTEGIEGRGVNPNTHTHVLYIHPHNMYFNNIIYSGRCVL